jgi:hypothetical protein
MKFNLGCVVRSAYYFRGEYLRNASVVLVKSTCLENFNVLGQEILPLHTGFPGESSDHEGSVGILQIKQKDSFKRNQSAVS